MLKRFKKFVLVAVAALAVFVPSVARADISTGNIAGDTWADYSGIGSKPVYGQGWYNGHTHNTLRINVTLQERVGTTWYNQASGEKYAYSTSYIDKTVSDTGCYGDGAYHRFRVKVRVRSYNQYGNLTGDATNFTGYRDLLLTCY